LSKLKFTNYQPILVVDFGQMVNHTTCLISSSLHNPCFLHFDGGGDAAWQPPSLGCAPATVHSYI